METLVRFIFDMLAFTSIMVLVVVGLGVVASMMGIFNFAHGELVLLGAYTAFVLQGLGLDPWWGIFAAPVAVGAVGLLIERTVVRHFYDAPVIAMLGTYALGLIIRELIRGFLGGHYETVTEPLPGFFRIGAMQFSRWRAVIIIVTVFVIAGSWGFIARTRIGLQIRGSLENPMLARACGISTSKLYALTFAFGSALAGLAGALIVPLYQLSADIGLRFVVQGFLSVMLGGAGTFEGPLAGATVVGGLTAGLPWAVPPVVADPLVFVIALLIVKLRPQGLLGLARR